MNSTERMVNRLRGLPVDRVPNFDILMMYAAHFIHQPLSRYYLDYRVLSEANFAVQNAFDLDIYQAISDPYREAADLGLVVDFPEDNLPVRVRTLLADPRDLGQLKLVDPGQGRRMSDRLAAVRWMAERSRGEVPVMGWVEGALAEAADLRGFSELLLDVYDRPEWLSELLEMCATLAIRFAQAQVQAGAAIIGLGDAAASQVSPEMYRKFALPYEQRIFKAVHELGAVARLHICGNTSRILGDMLESGADIIDVDWMVDYGRAAAVFGERAAVCGNFDPVAVMLQGSPEQVYRATTACLATGGKRSFSAAGCEIPDQSPERNLQAQRQALFDHSNL
jgi:uroporphyrinogen decarboxylase